MPIFPGENLLNLFSHSSFSPPLRKRSGVNGLVFWGEGGGGESTNYVINLWVHKSFGPQFE